MNGGKECEGGDREGPPPTVQVPIGWRREAGSSGVIYISPSGSMMSCLEQVKTYLLTDGTCKCGLECPLILHKVFNFDPGAAVRQRTAEDAKADEDVTKLCIHKRKIIAVATLHKSMEAPHPSLVLTSPGGGTSAAPLGTTRPATPRAIRNKVQEGLSNSIIGDCQNPFKAIMAGQRPYQQNVSVTQKAERYVGHPRQRLGSGEQGHKSPYLTGGHGGLLSPTSSGSLVYGDASVSPRSEPMGSPDTFTRAHPGPGFHGSSSPGSVHGSRRTPLSPSGTLHHGSPVAQSSCAMVGRTNMPLSPTLTAKSPVMKKPMCSFTPALDVSRSEFHHKAPPPPPPPLPPPCILQKKQVTSEKDPLGILDPIPSKPVSQGPMAMNPSGFQPSVHSQVPMMNVNIPPAIVPLPSNLPLPTVKPGPVSHGGHPQRLQHATPTSLSSSPVTSPVHMTGPAMARVEASPQRSRSSSSSSDHGSFVVPPGGAQAPCSSLKAPARSPRSSIGSPRPSIPSSPSAKSDLHHPSKEHPNQLLAGVNSVLGSPHGAMFPPASAGNIPQKGHPSLLGMPLNQILNQHNATSFPASNLLSAAAKAQLANQNKLTGGSAGTASGGNGNHLASAESHGAVPAAFASSEGQSGRAALRDKLMAQQRDPLRKRKAPDSSPAGGPMGFGSGPVSQMGPPEQPRKAVRTSSGLHHGASMAELLQSMSCQNSLSSGNSTSGQLHFGEGVTPSGPALHRLQVPPQLHGFRDGPLGATMDSRTMQGRTQSVQVPFSGVMSHVQSSPVSGCAPHTQARLLRNHLQGPHTLGNPSLGHSTPHIQQLAHHHHHQNQAHPLSKERASMANGEMCIQATSDHGDPSTQMCTLGSPQLTGLQALPHNGHMVLQPSRMPQGAHRGSAFQGSHHFPDGPFPNRNPPNPMACLFQNFQAGMAESLSVPNRQLSAQSEMSLPEHPGTPPFPPPFLEGPSELQVDGSQQESVDAIYRAVVEAAGKGVAVDIASKSSPAPVTTLSGLSNFISLPQPVSTIAHTQRPPCQEAESHAHPSRGSHPCVEAEHGKGAAEGMGERNCFRSPNHGTSRGQWESEMATAAVPGHDGLPPWRGDEYLECSARVQGSPCTELPHERIVRPEDTHRFSSCQRAAANFKDHLEQTVERCSHMNGTAPSVLPHGYGDILGIPRQEHPLDSQSPSSSTSLEGPLVKDYGLYNGHHNGCAPSPSDTKSLSSEEEQRLPDSPSSSDLLHYQPRVLNVGDLLWGQIKGFPRWSGKLGADEQPHLPGMPKTHQGKVEPEKLKTLTEDLEALSRAANRKGGKLNNHLEAAIQEAMSELDKMSGSVHHIPPRDGDVKPPKPKRRKISR